MMAMRNAMLETAPASSGHHLQSLVDSGSLAFRGFGTLSWELLLPADDGGLEIGSGAASNE
jgi:hypothetical protein